ncbi:hypothetical protein SDJN02_15855, partial [Cucurbita argyrosperma subsp. argyrosperma]
MLRMPIRRKNPRKRKKVSEKKAWHAHLLGPQRRAHHILFPVPKAHMKEIVWAMVTECWTLPDRFRLLASERTRVSADMPLSACRIAVRDLTLFDTMLVT